MPAPVRLAGVHVGEVEEISILKVEGAKPFVEVVARIANEAEIDSTAEVRIGNQGLLGRKYLEILPGSGTGDPVSSSDWILGEDPVNMDMVAATGQRVVTKLETTVESMNRWLGDEDFRGNVKQNLSYSAELISNMREVVTSLKVLLKRMNSGEGTLGKLVTDDTLYEDLKLLVKDLKANPWKLLHKTKTHKN